ncbi:MAG: iron-sulfur cluster assembly accessory protein [Chitinophagales bacterium]|jgi:iron-sulfur cluster assembly accessory protein
MDKVISELAKKVPLKFSSTALAEIKRLSSLEEEGKILFVGVKNGGCSGFSYVFEFKHVEESYTIYNVEDFQLAINDEDLQYINNLFIDYEQGLNNRGFTFENPNADTTCGCGTSFA